jgi:D-glycero-D-manno-heptose 1,7-bisphosphate phosphatase
MDCIFLDRDGVLVEDVGHPITFDKKLLNFPFIFFLRGLTFNESYNIHVVSNQSSYARKNLPLDLLYEYTFKLNRELNLHGIFIDSYQYCTHLPIEHCSCRKPSIRLIEYISFNKETSYFFGDKLSDTQFANKAGFKNIFLYNFSKYHTLEQVNAEKKKINFNILLL